MYDLILRDGSALSADGVVLATPAYVSADLLRPLTPIAGSLLDMIPYASTATIAMAFQPESDECYRRIRIYRAANGAASCHCGNVDLAEVAVSRSGGSAVGALLCRWSGREDILQLDDGALTARVRGELAAVCGIRVEPHYAEVNRWWKAMPQYTLGHLDRVAQLEAAVSRYSGLVLTGAGYRGVGIPDCIWDGAVAGERVVQDLLGETDDDPTMEIG